MPTVNNPDAKPKCGPKPAKLEDLSGKTSLEVLATNGVTYVGNNPVCECLFKDFSGAVSVAGMWVLTITLLSDGTQKVFLESDISDIKRNI